MAPALAEISPPLRIPQAMRPLQAPCELDLMLADLPLELADLLFSYLSVADLHAMRLAGVGLAHPPTQALLRSTLRARIRSLQRLLHAGDATDLLAAHARAVELARCRGDPCLDAPASPTTYSEALARARKLPEIGLHALLPAPSALAEFGSRGEKLRVSRLTPAVADAIAQELPLLREVTLDLRRGGDNVDGTLRAACGVAGWRQVRVLRLHNGATLTALPSCVMSLHGLEVLDLDGLPRLETLPDDMGARLPRLRFLDVARTGVSCVPPSLLSALEANIERRGGPTQAACDGVRAGGNRFPARYWMETLGAEEFPRLAAMAHEYGAYVPFFSDWGAAILERGKL